MDAKADLARLLDRTPDDALADAMVEAFDKSVSNGHNLGARLVVGEWGADYLRARFREDPARVNSAWASVRAQALRIGAAKWSGRRKTACLLATKTDEIKAAFFVGREAALLRLETAKG